MCITRSKSKLGDFYRRLIEAGKPPKVALIAVARKIVVIGNAKIKERLAQEIKSAA
jgi:transposase